MKTMQSKYPWLAVIRMSLCMLLVMSLILISVPVNAGDAVDDDYYKLNGLNEYFTFSNNSSMQYPLDKAASGTNWSYDGKLTLTLNNFKDSDVGIVLHTTSTNPYCLQFGLKLEGSNNLASITRSNAFTIDENQKRQQLATSLYVYGSGDLTIPNMDSFTNLYVAGSATVSTSTTIKSGHSLYVAKDASYKISESGNYDYELDLDSYYYIAGNLDYTTLSNTGFDIWADLSIANTGKVSISPGSACESITLRTSDPGRYTVKTSSGASCVLNTLYPTSDSIKNYMVYVLDSEDSTSKQLYGGAVNITGNDSLPSMEAQLIPHRTAVVNVTQPDALTSKSVAQTYQLKYSCATAVSSFKAMDSSSGDDIDISNSGILTIPANFVGTIVIHAISKGTDLYYSNASDGAAACYIQVKQAASSGNSSSSGETGASKATQPAVGDIVSFSKNQYKVVSTGKSGYTLQYIASTGSAKAVKIPATVSFKGKSYKVVSVAANAFKGNKKISTVTIGSNVTSIGSNAFSACKSLKTVNLTKATKLKTIGASAFNGCKKLKTLTISSKKLTKKSVKSALKGSSIKTIKVPAKKLSTYKKYFAKKNSGKKITVKKK